MKMTEFLALDDDGKVSRIEEFDHEEGYDSVTEDKGKCGNCEKEADAGHFCFGCHQLICNECTEIEPHYSACLNT